MVVDEIAVGKDFIVAQADLKPNISWFQPEYWMGLGSGEPLSGGRGSVVTAGAHGQWVLRHYWRGGLPSQVLRDQYLWLGAKYSRPVKEFHVTRILRERGAPVPMPIAARVRRHGLWYQGDILIKRIPEAYTLVERAADLPSQMWFLIGQSIGHFHNCGGYHPDLNAYNILLTEAGVYLIDLDRGCLVKPGSHGQVQNIRRLRRSLSSLLEGGEESRRNWTSLVRGWKSVKRR